MGADERTTIFYNRRAKFSAWNTKMEKVEEGLSRKLWRCRLARELYGWYIADVTAR